MSFSMKQQKLCQFGNKKPQSLKNFKNGTNLDNYNSNRIFQNSNCKPKDSLGMTKSLIRADQILNFKVQICLNQKFLIFEKFGPDHR